jgi:hypothetical protein
MKFIKYIIFIFILYVLGVLALIGVFLLIKITNKEEIMLNKIIIKSFIIAIPPLIYPIYKYIKHR